MDLKPNMSKIIYLIAGVVVAKVLLPKLPPALKLG